MRILTVVGARPQFVKAAVLSQALARHPSGLLQEVMVHTGQHHDARMSDIFFEELGLAPPSHHLGIAGGSHGAMTGRMLESLETVMLQEQPDWVLVYGDTNSTLAAALAAVKLHINVAHVEAGLRSFNMRMPEEINRIVADRVSKLLLCPTQAAVDNLSQEGRTAGVHLVGDVMYDAALRYAAAAQARSNVLTTLGLTPNGYVLATCHRAENTDDPVRLRAILEGLSDVSADIPVIFPLHPRTRQAIDRLGLPTRALRLVDPISYLDMVTLEKHAAVIVTDSGGVQKEAFFYRVPCVTTRDQTEWVETVQTGWNVLVGADRTKLRDAVWAQQRGQEDTFQPYGNGASAGRMADLLLTASH